MARSQGSLVARTPARERRRRGLAAVAFCSAIGRALHETGTSAARLEARMGRLSRALGVPGQFSANPTAFLAQYRLPGTTRSHAESVRVRPGAIDLARQAALERLVDQVVAGELGLERAGERLGELLEPGASPVASFLGAAAVSASAAVFLGGGPAEVVAAAVAGLLVGILEALAVRRGTEERLVAPAAGFVVALATTALAGVVPGFSIATAQVASLIILVPGLDFTLAIKEIATSHLVSGSARLTSAVGDFLLLGFGLAAGSQVGTRLLGAPAYVDAAGLPDAIVIVALPVAALAFAQRFRADARQVPWVLVAAVVAFGGARLGNELMGSDLGAFVGALAVGLVANGYARATGGASIVISVPGLIMLVPGSFGLRALELVRRHDTLHGLESGLAMALIATGLSTGLLLANLVLPGQRRAEAGSESGLAL